MAYLTAAKREEIQSNYRETLPNEAIAYLLDEMALMEASIAAGGGIDWGEVGDIASIAVAKAAGSSTEFARADHAHDLAAELFFSGVFTGAVAAGPCTLTGAKVGDKVVMLTNLTDEADGSASFESTITVENQIQQTSASDLHEKKLAVLLLVKS